MRGAHEECGGRSNDNHEYNAFRQARTAVTYGPPENDGGHMVAMDNAEKWASGPPSSRQPDTATALALTCHGTDEQTDGR